MERLTDKEKLNHFCSYYVGENCCYDCGDCYLQKLYNRLAELEDKLESGQLVELPCKVGDTIFVPYVYNGLSAIMRLPVYKIQIDKNAIEFSTYFETDDELFAIKFRHGLFLLDDFGDIWFTDKAQAEARLKELQEEQKNG